MNNIITRGLGKLQSLITRGYSKTLVIVVTPDIPQHPAAIVSPAKFWDTVSKYIKTKRIHIPDEDDDIVCDVLLLNKNDLGYMNDAILLSQKYTDIKVYNITEVKIK